MAAWWDGWQVLRAGSEALSQRPRKARMQVEAGFPVHALRVGGETGLSATLGRPETGIKRDIERR